MEAKTYTGRLEVLNLDSLQLRRLKVDILTYKIIFGVNLDADKFFKLCLDDTTRAHEFKIILNILLSIYVSLREFHRYGTKCHRK